MLQLKNVLSLPTSLLLLIAVTPLRTGSELQWPYNLPADVKYFPEDEVHVKRGLAAQAMFASRTPVGVRKMSADEGEMFFLDYWQFDGESEQELSARSTGQEEGWGSFAGRVRSLQTDYANWTAEDGLLPPLLVHANERAQETLDHSYEYLRRSNMVARDFSCPTGYSNCSGIQRPNSCCANGESCLIVPDTGRGDVGCCPSGGTCGGQVQSCDTGAGYNSCPTASGGGCCIPNFTCFDIGCVSTTTSYTTTTAPLATVTASRNCTSGFQSCPASLGGGCCPSAAVCGSSTSCITTSTSTTTTTLSTSTSAPLPPLRPTGPTNSSAETAIAPSTLTTGTSLIAVCPTNYYFCSAYYRPGCCRVGRDCALTSCPAAASSSAVVSNGVTVLVPVGASTGGSSYVTTALITGAAAGGSSTITYARAGSCEAGWASCAASLSGGCCPPGYACGSGTLCPAVPGQATGTVTKLPPTGAGVGMASMAGWAYTVLAAGLAFGMVVL